MAANDSLHVRYHMDRNFIKLKANQEISEVIELFNKHHIFSAPVVDDLGNLIGYSCLYVAEMFIKDTYRRYPVIENDHIVGTIGREEILKALESHLNNEQRLR